MPATEKRVTQLSPSLVEVYIKEENIVAVDEEVVVTHNDGTGLPTTATIIRQTCIPSGFAVTVAPTVGLEPDPTGAGSLRCIIQAQADELVDIQGAATYGDGYPGTGQYTSFYCRSNPSAVNPALVIETIYLIKLG